MSCSRVHTTTVEVPVDIGLGITQERFSDFETVQRAMRKLVHTKAPMGNRAHTPGLSIPASRCTRTRLRIAC